MLHQWHAFFPALSHATVDGAYQRALWGTMLLVFHALLRGSEYAWKGRRGKWTACAWAGRATQ